MLHNVCRVGNLKPVTSVHYNGGTMRRFGSIALALVFAAGCTGRDGVHDAGDAVRGLVRVDLSYTHVAGAHRGRRALRRPGALRPLPFVRRRQRADHPRLRRLRRRPARRLQGLRRHRRARLRARRRHHRADGRGVAARRRPPRAARPHRSRRAHRASLSRARALRQRRGLRRRRDHAGRARPRPALPDRRRGRQRSGPVQRDGRRAAQLPDAAGRSAASRLRPRRPLGDRDGADRRAARARGASGPRAPARARSAAASATTAAFSIPHDAFAELPATVAASRRR